MTKPTTVELYALEDCTLCAVDDCALCKDARSIIGRASRELPFEFKEVGIDSSEDLLRRYKGEIPTVFINGKKVFKYKVDEAEFKKRVRKEIIKAGISRIAKK
ncbi:MAG: glutaredoxin family protein [Deltaproteobacteria bacterium]|nr:glutaredoxin family protein [Deltaproteobacteria bacterium]MBZ0218948.1 glutaredoxin family protein [Deltaproteobacteria bacterium]